LFHPPHRCRASWTARCRRTRARRTSPSTTLDFRSEVMAFGEDAHARPPPNGVYVYGLYLEGARWDPEAEAPPSGNPAEDDAADAGSTQGKDGGGRAGLDCIDLVSTPCHIPQEMLPVVSSIGCHAFGWNRFSLKIWWLARNTSAPSIRPARELARCLRLVRMQFPTTAGDTRFHHRSPSTCRPQHQFRYDYTAAHR